MTPEEKLTKGAQKLNNYFEEILRSDFFRRNILEWRRKYKIPPSGFIEQSEREYFTGPERWAFRGNAKYMGMIRNDIGNMCDKLGLKNASWGIIIWNYLFYNNTKSLLGLGLPGLCLIYDAIYDKRFFGLDQPEFAYIFQGLENRTDQEFPVAIKISPYASERDILDFIKKNYGYIRFYQEQYKDKKSKIGRVKTKNPNIRKRNDFIYRNQHLPKKNLVSLVNSMFPNQVDQGSVGKIISLENKMRKDM